MRKILPIFLVLVYFFLSPLFIICQDVKKLDSLFLVLETSHIDTIKVKALNLISRLYREAQKYPDAKENATKALSLAEKINFKQGLASAHKEIGEILYELEKFPESINHFFILLDLYKQLDNKYQIGNTYNDIAILYAAQSDYTEAIKNYTAAQEVWGSIGNKQGVAHVYNNIGIIHYEQGNFTEALKNHLAALKIREELKGKRDIAVSMANIGLIYSMQKSDRLAIRYHEKAIELYKEIGNRAALINCYFNVGFAYQRLGQSSEALKSFFESLQIAKDLKRKAGTAASYANIGNLYVETELYDEALKHYNQALDLYLEMGNQIGAASIYNGIGTIDEKRGNYSEALKNYTISLEIRKKNNDKLSLIGSYLKIAKLFLIQKKTVEAKMYAGLALSLAKETQLKQEIRESYLLMSDIDGASNNMLSALENYKAFISYKDSLNNEEKTAEVTSLQLQYDFDKKEDSLKYQQSLTDEKLKQQTLLSQQQLQALLLKENQLSLTIKEKEIQRLAFLQTQSDLQLEQIKRSESEKELLLTSQEKDLQSAQINLQKKDLQQKRTQRNILIAGTIALLLLLFFIFRNFQNQRKANKFMQTAAEKQMVELQLENLRAQLNPHFMFNSLNAIQELIVTDKTELSQTYLERFAKLLRMLLENANQPFIHLRKEINFLELYLSLENLRIPDLKYSIQVDQNVNTETTITPNMMLQPYIENALWHGLQNKQGDKILELNISREKGSVNYEIRDNGVGRKKAQELKGLYRKEHRSKGMELLSKRFSLLSKEYGKDIVTEVNDINENGTAAGTVVKIKVPNSLTEIPQHS